MKASEGRKRYDRAVRVIEARFSRSLRLEKERHDDREVAIHEDRMRRLDKLRYWLSTTKFTPD